MNKKGGLGKGLSALIPGEVAAAGGMPMAPEGPHLIDAPVNAIVPNQYQPRRYFDEDSLLDLTASVRELGVLQPVLVRSVGEGEYELIAGERRWRAAKRAGLQTIPAIVREVGDVTSLEQAVVENLHRDDLNPLEEAAAYQQLLEDFSLTQEQVAQRVGKSRSAVTNTLRLFQLPARVQAMVAEGVLAAGHARALLGTPDRAQQEALADRVVTQRLSVREVEQLVRDTLAGPSPDRQGSSDAPAPGTTKDAAVLELEELLSSRLDTRVNVQLGASRGRITIDFADLDDLERLYRIIAAG